MPEFSIDSVRVDEGDSGTKTATLKVRLSRAFSTDLTVKFATAPVTATEGEDYVGQAGLLTFIPGQLSKTISIVINGDTMAEDDEFFFVELKEANIDVDNFLGLVTITNEDASEDVRRSGNRS